MKSSNEGPNLWLGFGVVSLTIIGFPLAKLGHLSYCDLQEKCDSFFSRLAKLPPNEIGDTLAGIFGSLAFLAAATAVVMQSIELREQRKEIREQRIATQDMAGSMQARAEADKARMLRDEMADFDELFYEKLARIDSMTATFRVHEQTWVLSRDNSIGRSEKAEIIFLEHDFPSSELRNRILTSMEIIIHRSSILQTAANGKGFEIRPFKEKRFLEFRNALASAIHTQIRGSSACQERAKVLRLQEALEAIDNMLADRRLWHQRAAGFGVE